MAAAITLPSEPQRSIFERAVCLSVTFRAMGTRRKVSSAHVEIDADKDLIHVSKDLLESPTLKEINSGDNAMRQWLAGQCLPSPFRAGVYIVPDVSVIKVRERLDAYVQVERPALVEKFVGELPALKARAQLRLRSEFNARQYPSDSRIRSMFGVDIQYLTFDTPERLREIDPTLWQQQIEEQQARMVAAGDKIVQLLRSSYADLVNHMVERLTVEHGGKPKCFRNTLVENVKAFIDSFAARNIVDDHELAALVEQADKLLEGVSPDALRENDSLRDKVRAGFEQVKASLDSMVTETGRLIDFDDE